jgi:hypothetical protein
MNGQPGHSFVICQIFASFTATGGGLCRVGGAGVCRWARWKRGVPHNESMPENREAASARSGGREAPAAPPPGKKKSQARVMNENAAGNARPGQRNTDDVKQAVEEKGKEEEGAEEEEGSGGSGVSVKRQGGRVHQRHDTLSREEAKLPGRWHVGADDCRAIRCGTTLWPRKWRGTR